MRQATTADLSLPRTRAAARLRAFQISGSERRAVREARAELGAAIRRARRRRESPAPVDIPLARPLHRSRSPLRLAPLAIAPLLALLAFSLVPRAAAPAEPAGGGSPPAAAAVDTTFRETTISRGRSTAAVTTVVVDPTPVPSERPTPAPGASAPAVAVAPTTVPGAGGGSGGGAGGSSGSGGGTAPAATSAPTPAPTPTPVPTLPPRAAGYTRFTGQVVDQRTGRPIEGACVIVGVRECSERDPYTDVYGRFWLDLPSGRQWDMNFAKAGYRTGYRHVSSDTTTTALDLGRVRLSR